MLGLGRLSVGLVSGGGRGRNSVDITVRASTRLGHDDPGLPPVMDVLRTLLPGETHATSADRLSHRTVMTVVAGGYETATMIDVASSDLTQGDRDLIRDRAILHGLSATSSATLVSVETGRFRSKDVRARSAVMDALRQVRPDLSFATLGALMTAVVAGESDTIVIAGVSLTQGERTSIVSRIQHRNYQTSGGIV